jgi:hypothetical protein
MATRRAGYARHRRCAGFSEDDYAVSFGQHGQQRGQLA